MEQVRDSRRWLSPGALLLFTLSGFAGLIYQSIWSQYLGLYLGHAAYAQCLVLAIFMGGMALGAWWVSRASKRWRNLLRGYAYAELAIGILAWAFDGEFHLLTGFAYSWALPAMPAVWLADLFKWSSGALLMLPQSILLGMTFPLMSAALIRRLRSGSGDILGSLYFTNSIGAAVGALCSTFVLLPSLGLPGTIRVGAALNLFIAVAAFLLSRAREDAPAGAALADPAASARRGMRLMLIAAFITGATSFVYEIGWVRMLNLALGATLHSFELMLTAFIAGLALGGLWIRRRMDGYADPVRIGGYVQILMGIAALVSLFLYTHSFDWVAWLLHALSPNDGGYVLYNVATAAISIAIMLPAAFFAGMTLPLFTFSLLQRGHGEASIGMVYAADTFGAIVGVFAAVHLLIPVLGLKLAMVAAATGDIALGIVLLRSSLRQGAMFGYFSVVALSCAVIAATLSFVRFDLGALAAGVYRTGRATIDADTQRVIYYRDGKTASISVVEYREGGRMIATNGKPDASIEMNPQGLPSPDEVTMVMAGVLPLAMHGAPEQVANIGFGSGLTTHTLLGDPRVKRVDSIEIEPAMYRGAMAFRPLVERAYSDPRAHIYFDDAKTYFASHHGRYDVIVSEPSNPWVSGVATLFSREFYGFVPHYMKPGGLFVQWMQLYEINDELVATVVNSLAGSFKDFRIYLTDDSDMVIVASPDRPLPELSPAVLQQAGLRPLLDRVGINGVADLEFREIGDRDSLLPLAKILSGRSNSDFYPVLSLEAPRARFEHATASAFAGLPEADLPYLETLGGTGPFPSAAITINTGLRRSLLLAQSMGVAATLDGRSGTPLDEATAADMATLARTGSCTDDESVSRQLDALARLAAATIPYLPAAELGGWDKPVWAHCAPRPPGVSVALATLRALAHRDAAAARDGATSLLVRYRPLLSDFAADYFLRVAMLSAIRQGDYAALPQLDDTLGRDVVPVSRATLIQRAYLMSYAADMQAGRK